MLTLLQDSEGTLWYKALRVDHITFDKRHKLGRLHCTDLARNCSVMVSISAQPKIEPMPSQRSEPAQPFDFTEYELERRKRDALLDWWYSKTNPS